MKRVYLSCLLLLLPYPNYWRKLIRWFMSMIMQVIV